MASLVDLRRVSGVFLVAVVVGLSGAAGAQAANITGTAGNDNLFGTNERDVIDALVGRDRVFARGGNDFVEGGDGPDMIFLGPGGDRDQVRGNTIEVGGAFGGAGGDSLIDDDGESDDLFSGAGDDLIISADGSGPAEDRVSCGSGNDTAFLDADEAQSASFADCETRYSVFSNGPGPNGYNMIFGTGAGEILNGSPGGDVIFGMGGSDTISGAGGDDDLFPGAGDDSVDGGNGNDDYFDDDAGADVLNDTGDGNDRFFAANGFSDGIICGSGTDTVFADPFVVDTVDSSCEIVIRG